MDYVILKAWVRAIILPIVVWKCEYGRQWTTVCSRTGFCISAGRHRRRLVSGGLVSICHFSHYHRLTKYIATYRYCCYNALQCRPTISSSDLTWDPSDDLGDKEFGGMGGSWVWDFGWNVKELW